MKEIQEHKIKIYEFPDTEDDEDNKLIRKIKVKSCKFLNIILSCNPSVFITALKTEGKVSL